MRYHLGLNVDTGQLINLITFSDYIILPPVSSLQTQFNGIDEYISFGVGGEASSFFSSTNSPITISMWIIPNIGGINQFLIGKYNYFSSTVDKGYRIYLDTSNKIRFKLGNNASAYFEVQSDIALNIGIRNHFTLTYTSGIRNPTAVNIYVNGMSSTLTVIHNDTISNSSLAAVNADLTIGAYKDTTNLGLYYNGKIDEVSLFNITLTPSEVNLIYNFGIPSDLSLVFGSNANFIHWWRLGEGGDDGLTVYNSRGALVGSGFNMNSTNIVAA